jgi:hypothetical protein
MLHQTFNGSAPDPGTFQQPLFSATDLSRGLHTIVLTNQENAYLDIDFVRATCKVDLLVSPLTRFLPDHLADNNRHERQ